MNDSSDKKPFRPSEEREIPEGSMGLARLIAKAGYASRRQAGEIVRSGRVTVDGKRVSDPHLAVTPIEEIKIDGHVLQDVIRIYYAFNKPLNVVTSATATHRMNLVSSYMPNDIPGLRSAGRLDATTSGLLLISNDSTWNSFAASGNGWDKEFLIKVKGEVNAAHIGLMSAGLTLPKIGHFRAEVCELLKSDPESSVIRFSMLGGKIRKMKVLFTALHLQITAIHRVRIGPIELGVLQPGKLRLLTIDQVRAIREGPGSKP